MRFRDLAAFTHGFYRDAVRNAFRLSTAYHAEDINSVRQTELIDRVGQPLRAAVRPYGVDLWQLGLPRRLVRRRVSNKRSNRGSRRHRSPSRRKTKKRQAIAEAAKVVEIAHGQAEASDLLTKSLTPQRMQ